MPAGCFGMDTLIWTEMSWRNRVKELQRLMLPRHTVQNMREHKIDTSIFAN